MGPFKVRCQVGEHGLAWTSEEDETWTDTPCVSRVIVGAAPGEQVGRSGPRVTSSRGDWRRVGIPGPGSPGFKGCLRIVYIWYIANPPSFQDIVSMMWNPCINDGDTAQSLESFWGTVWKRNPCRHVFRKFQSMHETVNQHVVHTISYSQAMRTLGDVLNQLQS